MRAALMLALAVSVTSFANAGTIDPAEAWRPMHPFIGTWKGTRTGAEGAEKVTRVYASAPTNHHLEIIENGGRSRAALRATVILDAEREVLVLRQFAADGSALDMPFDAAVSTTAQLVFASPESAAERTRITYERTGTDSFVERVEHSAGGEAFTSVSETRFVRSN